MDEFLDTVVIGAMFIKRPPEDQCAIEKYTQMTPDEVNESVTDFVTEAASVFKFYPAEHDNWVHSGSITQDPDGPRLLDVFFLKSPAILVPDSSDLWREYEWHQDCMPSSRRVRSFDEYMEGIACHIYWSLERYRNALQEWAVLGRPSELKACLRNADGTKLAEYRDVQKKRVRSIEQVHAGHYNADAPDHLLERILGSSFREQMVLQLLEESISLL